MTMSVESTIEIPAQPSSDRADRLDPGRFWVGSALSAGIAALVALIGLIITHDLLHLPVLMRDDGRLVAVGFGAYVLIAGAAAIAASALYTGVLHFAPRPRLYFGWITSLGTVLAVLIPLTAGTTLVDALTLSIMNLVVGLVITVLVPVAADRTTRR